MNNFFAPQYFKIIFVLWFSFSFGGFAFGLREGQNPRNENNGVVDDHVESSASQEFSAFDMDEKFINALISIESANNPLAHNKKTGGRGLTQITPRAWQDLVRCFPEKYHHLNYPRDIFSPIIARAAGSDYLRIIKRYLKKKDIPVTVDTVIAAYNWGIGNLSRRGVPRMPRETRKYIKKMGIILAYAK